MRARACVVSILIIPTMSRGGLTIYFSDGILDMFSNMAYCEFWRHNFNTIAFGLYYCLRSFRSHDIEMLFNSCLTLTFWRQAFCVHESCVLNTLCCLLFSGLCTYVVTLTSGLHEGLCLSVCARCLISFRTLNL